jgi:putative SOS response-associated peptidase YedK
MCYNISLIMNMEYLEKRFVAKFEQSYVFKPIYHSSGFSAPNHPIIANNDIHLIQFFRWGLIPFWVKDEEEANRIRFNNLNARAESIHQKPSFRASIKSRRCLVLVDGFYEWQEVDRKKYPYYIRLRDHGAFAFAGI